MADDLMMETDVNCPNCGEGTYMLDEPMIIYPCARCGHEFDLGNTGKPLGSDGWAAVIRRLEGDLASHERDVVRARKRLNEAKENQTKETT